MVEVVDAARYLDPSIESIAKLDTPQFVQHTRPVLRAIMHGLHRGYGNIPGDKVVAHMVPDPKGSDRENPLVVLGTGKCGYAEGTGGCSMCAFGEGKTIPPSIADVDHALDDIIFKRNEEYLQTHPDSRVAVININAIGSFFGDGELTPLVRDHIFERIKKYKVDADANGQNRIPVFVTEARFDDISEQKVTDMEQKLGQGVYSELGFGVESTDELVRESIVNKGLDPQWKEKAAMLKQHGIDVVMHVMYGTPFLDKGQRAADTIRSIKECLPHTDRVLFMVMNDKPGTLTHYLRSHNEYTLPTVTEVAQVLTRLASELTPRELEKIGVLGLVSPDEHVEAGTVNITPVNRNEESMYAMLKQWRGTQEQVEGLRALMDRQSLQEAEALPTDFDSSTLKEKIVTIYLRMMKELYPKLQIETLDDAYELYKGLDPEGQKPTDQ
jgi:radical SAM enzyme (TIGR01210 family)